ncbi:MAG TPA: hypothetical protein VGG59_04520, partial [Acidobacteriaceae bacterium]
MTTRSHAIKGAPALRLTQLALAVVLAVVAPASHAQDAVAQPQEASAAQPQEAATPQNQLAVNWLYGAYIP